MLFTDESWFQLYWADGRQSSVYGVMWASSLLMSKLGTVVKLLHVAFYIFVQCSMITYFVCHVLIFISHVFVLPYVIFSITQYYFQEKHFTVLDISLHATLN